MFVREGQKPLRQLFPVSEGALLDLFDPSIPRPSKTYRRSEHYACRSNASHKARERCRAADKMIGKCFLNRRRYHVEVVLGSECEETLGERDSTLQIDWAAMLFLHPNGAELLGISLRKKPAVFATESNRGPTSFAGEPEAQPTWGHK